VSAGMRYFRGRLGLSVKYQLPMFTGAEFGLNNSMHQRVRILGATGEL